LSQQFVFQNFIGKRFVESGIGRPSELVQQGDASAQEFLLMKVEVDPRKGI